MNKFAFLSLFLCFQAVVQAASVATSGVSAGAYVQDGLLLHWDGYENAGAGQHDSAATTWKDLTSNNRTGTLAGTYRWTDSSVYLDSVDAAAANRGYISFNGTHESAFTMAICHRVFKAYGTYGRITGENGTPAMCCDGSTSSTPYVYGFGNDRAMPGATTYNSQVVHTSALTQNGTVASGYFWYNNGVKLANDVGSAVSTGANPAYIANRGTDKLRGLSGDYYGVRLYNRVLTTDELTFNANLDQVRFNGVDPATLTRPAGKWYATVQTKIVIPTSGGVEVSLNGTSWSTKIETTVPLCTPVTVYARHADGKPISWLGLPADATVANAGQRVTFRAFHRSPKVRSSISSKHYVQNGLIWNLDGIENVAYGDAHSLTATKWTDLTGNGYNVSLGTVAKFGETGLNVVRTGRLPQFLGDVASKMSTAYGAARYTFECAYDKTNAATKTTIGYQNFRTTFLMLGHSNYKLGGLMAENQMGFNPNGAGNDATISKTANVTFNFGRHTVSCSQDGSSYAMRFDAVVPTGGTGTVTPSASVSTSHGSYVNGDYRADSGLDGVLHAIRFYDRPLTADEVAYNYNLDQVRFFGVDGATLTWPTGSRWQNGKLELCTRVTWDTAKGGVAANGVALSGGSAEVWAEVGSEVTLTATPASGQSFCRWTGDDFALPERHRNLQTAVIRSVYNGSVKAEFAAALSSVPSRYYIQSGLIAQWDGIENLSNGVHSASAAYPSEIVSHTEQALTGTMAASATYFSLGSGYLTFKLPAALAALNEGHASVEMHVAKDGTMVANGGYVALGHNTRGFWHWQNASKFLATYSYLCKATGEYDSLDLDPSTATTASFLLGPSTASSWLAIDGALSRSGLTRHTTTCATSDNCYLGTIGGSYVGTKAKAKMYALRLYDRQLSATEVAINANLDKVRFDGASLGSLTWPDDCRVTGSKLEYRVHVNWNPSYGAVSVNGTALSGGSADAWVEAGTAVTLKATPSSGKTFKTWELGTSDCLNSSLGAETVTMLAGPETVQASFVGDGTYCSPKTYIQKGLLVNFDAIDNAGYDQHDDAATTWVNLASGASNATMPAGAFAIKEKSIVLTKGRAEASDFAGALQGGSIMLESYVKMNNVGTAVNHIPFLTAELRGCIGYDSRYGYGYAMYGPNSMNWGSQLTLYKWWGGFNLADRAYVYHTVSADCPVSDARNGTTGKVYMDGTAQAYRSNWTSGTASAAPNGKVYIGNAACEYEIGNARIYSRALTAKEAVLNANVDKMRFEGKSASDLTWPEGYRYQNGKLQFRVRLTGDAAGGKLSINGSTPVTTSTEMWLDVNAEDDVQVAATPSSGYVFCGWTGDTDDFVFDQFRAKSASLDRLPRTLNAEFRQTGKNIHYVPDDFATLQTALASATVKEADTIVIKDGTYAFSQEATEGALTYLASVKRFVTVRGSSFDKVILDCGGAGGLCISNRAALVEGVTILNFQRTTQMYALDLYQGVLSNACISGRSGKCMSVSSAKPAMRTFDGGLFTDSVVTNVNKQNWDSSGVVLAKGTTFRRTKFYGNVAYNYILSAEALNGVRPRIEGCTFIKNGDYYRPMVTGSNFDMIDCVGYGNSSSDAGAGLNLSGTCTLSGCIITNNTLGGSCPLVLCNASANVSVTNCLFANNTIANWGAFKVSSGVKLSLVNSTVAHNKSTSASYAGGLTGDGASGNFANVMLRNTVFWGNTANKVEKNFLDSYSYTVFAFTNSCFTGIVPTYGKDNTDFDPKLKDPDHGNFRIGDGSSCIDAGIDSPTVTVDLDGKARPIDGIGNGTAEWDIGCYEADGPTYPLKAVLRTFGDNSEYPCSATQQVVVTGAKLTGLSYTWTATRNANGVISKIVQTTTSPENVFANLQPGNYSFTCKVSNNKGDVVEDTVENAFVATVGTVYVSKGGSETWPYDTLAKASRNFTNAVAIAGGRVMVSSGVYTVPPYVDATSGNQYQATVRRATSIIGLDDPSLVVVDCGGMGGFRLEHKDAMVSGMTFTNFVATTGTGPALYLQSGSASNLVFHGSGVNGADQPCVYLGDKSLLSDAKLFNFVTTAGSNRRLIRSVGGTIRRCHAFDCRTSIAMFSLKASSGGITADVDDCVIENCRITSSSALLSLDSACVTGSLIQDNEVANKGAELVTGTRTIFTNCILVRNTARAQVTSTTIWSGQPTVLNNCLVAHNNNGSYAAIAQPNGASFLELHNSTVIHNSSSSGAAVAGGVHGVNQVVFDNCIIWKNTVTNSWIDVSKTATTKNYSYSCFKEAEDYPDKHNITGGDRVVVKSNGKLTTKSPCRDAGLTKAAHSTGKDLFGGPRLVGPAVDIGCHEASRPNCFNLIFR